MAFFTIHPREMEQIILNKHALVLDVRSQGSTGKGILGEHTVVHMRRSMGGCGILTEIEHY